jgi:hypothetical protein
LVGVGVSVGVDVAVAVIDSVVAGVGGEVSQGQGARELSVTTMNSSSALGSQAVRPKDRVRAIRTGVTA